MFHLITQRHHLFKRSQIIIPNQKKNSKKAAKMRLIKPQLIRL